MLLHQPGVSITNANKAATAAGTIVAQTAARPTTPARRHTSATFSATATRFRTGNHWAACRPISAASLRTNRARMTVADGNN